MKSTLISVLACSTGVLCLSVISYSYLSANSGDLTSVNSGVASSASATEWTNSQGGSNGATTSDGESDESDDDEKEKKEKVNNGGGHGAATARTSSLISSASSPSSTPRSSSLGRSSSIWSYASSISRSSVSSSHSSSWFYGISSTGSLSAASHPSSQSQSTEHSDSSEGSYGSHWKKLHVPGFWASSSLSVIPVETSSDRRDDNGNDDRDEDDSDKRKQETDNQIEHGSSSASGQKDRGVPLAAGCFDRSGQWTDERNNCDNDQMEHLRQLRSESPASETSGVPAEVLETAESLAGPTAVPVTEEETVELLKERFTGTDVITRDREELLVTLQSAQQKLAILKENVDVPEIAATLQRGLQRLQDVEQVLKQTDSLEEIQMTAALAKAVISQAAVAARRAAPVLPAAPSITAILERLQKLLAAVPDAVELLVSRGAPLSADLVEEYTMTTSLFDYIKQECPYKQQVCSRASEVLDGLDRITQQLDEAANQVNGPDLREEVEQLFERT